MQRPFSQLGPRVRLGLARRPWIRWGVVGLLAVGTGVGVSRQLDRVDAARESWISTRQVAVATHDHTPGDRLRAAIVELPLAALPATATETIDDGALVRQHIAAGEVIVDADLQVGLGPAARAADGTVVVPVSDPLVTEAPIGASVSIYSEGLVLAAVAEIVDARLDVAYVAVDPADAPLVAAAAQLRTASIVFTR